jgi:hypothetical protein
MYNDHYYVPNLIYLYILILFLKLDNLETYCTKYIVQLHMATLLSLFYCLSVCIYGEYTSKYMSFSESEMRITQKRQR